LTAVGAAIALVSAFIVTAAVMESATGGDSKASPGVYAGLIAFFGGVMVSGAYLVWRMLLRRPASSGAARPDVGSTGTARRPAGQQTTSPSDAPPATAAERERRVLRLAEAEHGRVTIPEVAARFGLLTRPCPAQTTWPTPVCMMAAPPNHLARRLARNVRLGEYRGRNKRHACNVSLLRMQHRRRTIG
jgi:hypothetical protein